MAQFYHGPLHHLYEEFDLDGYLQSIDEELIPLEMGHFVDGYQTRYLIHPEELFLFTLTKLATGRTNSSIVDGFFGGDYTRWSYGYRWMLILKYINDRYYANVIGHQGLARYVHDFPQFHCAIERYVQKDRNVKNEDGTYTVTPGLEFLPFDVF